MLPWKGNAPGSAVTFATAPMTSLDENNEANQSKFGILKYWNWKKATMQIVLFLYCVKPINKCNH